MFLPYHVTGYGIDARFADFDTAEAYLWAKGYLPDDAAPGQYVRRWEVSPRMFARTWAIIEKTIENQSKLERRDISLYVIRSIT